MPSPNMAALDDVHDITAMFGSLMKVLDAQLEANLALNSMMNMLGCVSGSNENPLSREKQ